MLRQQFSTALKQAMTEKNKEALATLRLILAALKDRDIEERAKGNEEGLGETAILQMLQTMIKQRRDSIDLYRKGGRQDLAILEEAEIGIIEAFLPKQLSLEEIKEVVATLITEKGFSSLRDMGPLMGILKADYAGQMDFSQASKMVKEHLSG